MRVVLFLGLLVLSLGFDIASHYVIAEIAAQELEKDCKYSHL